MAETPSARGPARLGFAAVAFAFLLGAPLGRAQTIPDLPEPADGIAHSEKNLVQPVLDQAAALPAQLTSMLLAAAPLSPCDGSSSSPCAPILATYARGEFEPPVATDINPDPKIVEVVLVAIPALWEFQPGVPTLVWTFNGTVPGPTIEANVGDEVIVHFVNLIDTPNGIHWHGVEVPATMDGSHVSGPAVPRGGTFDYRFRVSRGSLFWYHPHHDAAQQVERGLYGALLVHDPAADKGLPANERLLVLDDASLAGDWQFETFEPEDPVERAAYLANGREGEVLIVNGRAGRTLPVEAGAPIRLRMVNTANSRFMRVNVPGHDLALIGTDGGLLEAPQVHTPIGQIRDPDPSHGGILVSDADPNHGVMITPGERADVVVTPQGKAGALLPVEWHDWGRGRHFYYKDASGNVVLFHVHSSYPTLPPQKLFDLQLVNTSSSSAYTLPSQLRTIERLAPAADANVLKLTLGHGDANPEGNIIFWMQQASDGTPLPFPLVDSSNANHATVGETAIWEVTNTSHGDHNFHTHGFDFQPLSIEYVSCDPTLNHTETFDFVEEKDTLRLPGPPMPACSYDANNKYVCPLCPVGTAYTKLRAAVRFDDTGRENDIEAFGGVAQSGHSGGWMVHCHILEHAANGMMTFFELRKPN